MSCVRDDQGGDPLSDERFTRQADIVEVSIQMGDPTSKDKNMGNIYLITTGLIIFLLSMSGMENYSMDVWM